MAITKANRSVPKKQSAETTTEIRRPLQEFERFPHTRFFHFQQAKGKTIEKIEFSASVDHHDITAWFTDKTSLNFSIEAGFTLKTEYSNWKSGEQRIVRSWPLFKSTAIRAR